MVEKYLLFVGENYYPEGGIRDFIGSYKTIEEAKIAIPKCDWAHIVDCDTMNIILNAGWFEDDAEGITWKS